MLDGDYLSNDFPTSEHTDRSGPEYGLQESGGRSMQLMELMGSTGVDKE
jgi:hypothetical protein